MRGLGASFFFAIFSFAFSGSSGTISHWLRALFFFWRLFVVGACHRAMFADGTKRGLAASCRGKR
jgi:hypothetical protein